MCPGTRHPRGCSFALGVRSRNRDTGADRSRGREVRVWRRLCAGVLAELTVGPFRADMIRLLNELGAGDSLGAPASNGSTPAHIAA